MYSQFGLSQRGLLNDTTKNKFVKRRLQPGVQPCLFRPPFNLNMYQLQGKPSKVLFGEEESRPSFMDSVEEQVCEFKVEKSTGALIPIKPRADKTEGNNIVVAYDNYASALNPLELADIFGLKNEYFAHKDPKYDSLKAFHRGVKFSLFDKFVAPDGTVLDIGVGTGQDIHRYYTKKTRCLVAVDPVFDSLHELQQRVLHKKSSPTYKVSPLKLLCVCESGDNTDTIFARMDSELPAPHPIKVDSVVLSFSIHYLKNIKETLTKVLDRLVDGGNIFILYLDTSDSKAIDELNSCSDGTFYVEKRGDNVALRLPFSGGELYEEKSLSKEYFYTLSTAL